MEGMAEEASAYESKYTSYYNILIYSMRYHPSFDPPSDTCFS
jgi:hypothetical protein